MPPPRQGDQIIGDTTRTTPSHRWSRGTRHRQGIIAGSTNARQANLLLTSNNRPMMLGTYVTARTLPCGEPCHPLLSNYFLWPFRLSPTPDDQYQMQLTLPQNTPRPQAAPIRTPPPLHVDHGKRHKGMSIVPSDSASRPLCTKSDGRPESSLQHLPGIASG